jgi:hypothetical protein
LSLFQGSANKNRGANAVQIHARNDQAKDFKQGGIMKQRDLRSSLDAVRTLVEAVATVAGTVDAPTAQDRR